MGPKTIEYNSLRRTLEDDFKISDYDVRVLQPRLGVFIICMRKHSDYWRLREINAFSVDEHCVELVHGESRCCCPFDRDFFGLQQEVNILQERVDRLQDQFFRDINDY